jgi:pyruvate formate lyase activating enzyme
MIRLGGLVPMSTVDFPGRLAAVAFLQGCPWRCGYCHNPHLLPASGGDAPRFADLLALLRRRRGLLDGVVFSGGEPTLQPRLGEAVDMVRALGFQVGLHTGGMYPRRLQALLPRLDWVGLDIKGPPSRHAAIVGRRDHGTSTRSALQALLAAGVDYECRTSWDPQLFPYAELLALAHDLAAHGVRHWALQQLRRGVAVPTGLDAARLAQLAAPFERFDYRGEPVAASIAPDSARPAW